MNASIRFRAGSFIFFTFYIYMKKKKFLCFFVPLLYGSCRM